MRFNRRWEQRAREFFLVALVVVLVGPVRNTRPSTAQVLAAATDELQPIHRRDAVVGMR